MAEELGELAEEYWERRMANEPVFATALGDRRFDGKLQDITPEGRQRAMDEYREVVRKAEGINVEGEADRITKTALIVDAQSQVDYALAGLDDWTVDPLRGPQVELMNVESYQPVRTIDEARAMVERWNAMGKFVDDLAANLRRSLPEGKVSVRAQVEKVIDELNDLMGKPDAEWALLRPLSVPHDDWAEGARAEFREGLRRAVGEKVHPAFSRYLQLLSTQVLPKARPDSVPGVMHLEGGKEAYRKLIRVHTSLGLTPEDLHSTGMREVARINSEMEEMGEKVFGTRDRKKILQTLRSDPSLYFSDGEEVFQKAEHALARAKAAIPQWFGRLPRTECEVTRMLEHEQKHSTIAYYLPPAEDGSRPGRYYINTSAPETRPRYEAEALAYHESIPGHHLQIAIAQELTGMPAFRRNGGVTAFVEGWGLYSERLAGEMGLFSSDLDRMGALSYDSWRACRLVVDTGMHAMGWTRDQAIEFMFENSALARNNIVNEVDRYITWPGQALAYKTGQLEILRLRGEAKARLGDRFDIRKFHDAVLCNGAVPLEVLRQLTSEYQP